MATAEQYAEWIVANQDKKGSPEFETVAQAYRLARNKPAGRERLPAEAAMQNLVLGGLRGAARIGNTLLSSPADLREQIVGADKNLSSLITGEKPQTAMDKRSAQVKAATETLGADPSSFWYQTGDIGTQILGTLGVGGGISQGAKAVAPLFAAKAAPLIDAVSTAGMRAGGLTGATGVATRAAGGAITGGMAAGLVNPGDALLGAGIGGVLPPILMGAGKAGQAVGSAVKSTEMRAAERIAKALGEDPAVVAQKLMQSRTLVPGSTPTVSQVLHSPQASTLERVVSESSGGAALKSKYAAQNEARLAALDRVAPTDPRGLRSAQQDFGASALDAVRKGDAGARAATGAAYKAIPQDEAALYLPDLAAIRDEFFPSGAFGGRESVDEAVRVAQGIGTGPAVKQAKAGKAAPTLAQFVRSRGGINTGGGLAGEASSLKGDLKNLVRANGGRNLNEMAEAAFEAGLIQRESPDALLDALRMEARGGSRTMTEQGMRASYERAMGEVPDAAPKKVTLGEFDALRKSIGNAQRAAARDPGRATEAAALSKMKAALDERIDEVVRGDGAIDENLPIEWADQLTRAQKLKRTQVETYRTGPQAQAFRAGSDNMPAVQGGQFTPLVWGNRQGIAEDLTQFRKIMDSKPDLLKQFKSMVTTEGANTATDGGKLTGKFVRWVDNSLPGLQASFKPQEVAMLKRVADDIRRANQAAAVGMAAGSPTYQNASNALSLGLLDSPMLNAAVNRIPVINTVAAPTLNWMREGARESLAREMAAYLADPRAAANALQRLQQAPSRNLLLEGLSRAAPVLAADR